MLICIVVIRETVMTRAMRLHLRDVQKRFIAEVSPQCVAELKRLHELLERVHVSEVC